MNRACLSTLVIAIGAIPCAAQAEKPDLPPPGLDAEEPPVGAESADDVLMLEGLVFGEPSMSPDVEVAEASGPEAPEIIIIEQAERPAPPAPSGAPPGTHSLLELNAGATLGGRPAEAGSALFGMGGKPVGFPWRFYFITEIGQAHIQDAGTLSSGMFEADRRYWNVAAGLRIYIPVWGPVRIFGDATLGGAYVLSSLLRRDLDPLEADDWYVMGAVAAGVQARVLHHLSIGVRGKLFFADDGLSDLRDRLDIAGGIPATVTAGLTWHI